MSEAHTDLEPNSNKCLGWGTEVPALKGLTQALVHAKKSFGPEGFCQLSSVGVNTKYAWPKRVLVMPGLMLMAL